MLYAGSYDGLNHRIARVAQNATTSTHYDRTDFYYNGSWQVLEERKDLDFSTLASATSTPATTPYAQYRVSGTGY